ncbi:crosslink repair DNA glycosylase YcaQ family protein [Vibrio sp. SCSIO 43136]|uniref:winged helix-turn-helix domain-containing protein n=1 Tax=Vibrio sp. SCSIO 43136 TaxID=2819101 RepID=UPI00207657CF|nr:crosslink repair DNA glycosylase YcaQ family protein [Vibrio sp. SCSIO 43136]USD66445.1 YcaQ family DNA glycosylase [Vibrio sp. SCSIO 43136]
MQTLSLSQARKLALLSQCLPHKRSKSSSVKSSHAATLSAIERLGYVQIDTISVVERAHHHVLWSRNVDYLPNHLDDLVANKQVYEYWSHAAAYLPMKDFRFSLPRKEALKSGQQNHWYRKDQRLMDGVLQRIKAEGPLMAKDFDSPSHKVQGWGSKPTKQALESLFMQGDLMIRERSNFHKVYDLTERVLPADIDTSTPTPSEHAKHLILSYLRAHGLGTEAEMTYQLKGIKPLVNTVLNEMCESGELEIVMVDRVRYYTTAQALLQLNLRLNRRQAVILSPFDNLVIQRKRIGHLFKFDYLLECYVPEAKRQYGYFCLPVLWNGKLVARIDAKVDRKRHIFRVLKTHIEPNLKRYEEFQAAFEVELQSFAQFNGCQVIER